jgi:hypothetical protein
LKEQQPDPIKEDVYKAHCGFYFIFVVAALCGVGAAFVAAFSTGKKMATLFSWNFFSF